MTISTRYIGFCPVCQRQIKVREGLLVHHGYQRPGTGQILGDCFGVGYPPHELSSKTAAEYLRYAVMPRVQRVEETLRRLGPPGEPESLFFDEYSREARRYVPVQKYRAEVSDYDWERRLKAVRAQAASELEFWKKEARRLEHLVTTWEPRPLATVEEEVAKAAEARTEREQRKAAEREQKSAEALVLLRQRVDRAVKKRDASALRDAFTYDWRKVAEPVRGELRREDVLRLLERDDVWRSVGWLVGDEYVSPEVADAAWRADAREVEPLNWPRPRTEKDPELASLQAARQTKREAAQTEKIAHEVSWRQQMIDDHLAAIRAGDKARYGEAGTLLLYRDYRNAVEKAPRLIGGRAAPEAKAAGYLRLLDRDYIWHALGWFDGERYDLSPREPEYGTPLPAELR